MSCNSRLKRLICRTIFQQNGVNTILKRVTQSSYRDEFGDEVPATYENREIRIAPRSDRRDEMAGGAGAYPDPAKEFLKFYAESSADIVVNDKIIWPPESKNEWFVDTVEAIWSAGNIITQEIKCSRDPRV